MTTSVSLDDTPEGGWKAAKGIPMPDFVEPVVSHQIGRHTSPFVLLCLSLFLFSFSVLLRDYSAETPHTALMKMARHWLTLMLHDAAYRHRASTSHASHPQKGL